MAKMTVAATQFACTESTERNVETAERITRLAAKEGANVVTVEKNIIGFGNTIADTAALEYQLESEMSKLEKSIGRKDATRIYKLCLDSISKIENINKEFKAPTGFLRQDNIYFTNKFMQRGSSTQCNNYDVTKRPKLGINRCLTEQAPRDFLKNI